jgi:hypothetical protein
MTQKEANEINKEFYDLLKDMIEKTNSKEKIKELLKRSYDMDREMDWSYCGCWNEEGSGSGYCILHQVENHLHEFFGED